MELLKAYSEMGGTYRERNKHHQKRRRAEPKQLHWIKLYSIVDQYFKSIGKMITEEK